MISNDKYTKLKEKIDNFDFENNTNKPIFLEDDMIEPFTKDSMLLGSFSNSYRCPSKPFQNNFVILITMFLI